ncbi:MAG: LysR family transcriptional regulator [Rhizobiales bacterium]|nr:LysR family transcriptional regulator [Hyphomicrobiales bacterium]
MKKIDIRRVDMGLLIVFQELFQHRKSVLVADRLGLTQSAISHALGRLRSIFDDELFVRKSAGFQPTPRALELGPQISKLIEMTEQLVNKEADFDPATADDLIRLGVSDFTCALIAPPLISCLRQRAPALTLSFRPIVRRMALDALASGDLNLAIGLFAGSPTGITIEPLYRENYVVIARKNHPQLKRGKLRLEEYVSLDHLLISPDGDPWGIVDTTLENLFHRRRIVATLPSIFPALSVVASSDIICTIPRRLANQHLQSFDLLVKEPPIRIRTFQVSMAWHAKSAKASLVRWLTKEIRQTVSEK